jgi:hypothetical protein
MSDDFGDPFYFQQSLPNGDEVRHNLQIAAMARIDVFEPNQATRRDFGYTNISPVEMQQRTNLAV